MDSRHKRMKRPGQKKPKREAKPHSASEPKYKDIIHQEMVKVSESNSEWHEKMMERHKNHLAWSVVIDMDK